MVQYEEVRSVTKYVRVMQDTYKDRGIVVRARSDKWVQGGGDIISGIGSERFLVCSADGQTNR